MNNIQAYVLNRAMQKVASKGLQKEAGLKDQWQKIKDSYNGLSNKEKAALWGGIGGGALIGGGIGGYATRKASIGKRVAAILGGGLAGAGVGGGIAAGGISMGRRNAAKKDDARWQNFMNMSNDDLISNVEVGGLSSEEARKIIQQRRDNRIFDQDQVYTRTVLDPVGAATRDADAARLQEQIDALDKTTKYLDEWDAYQNDIKARQYAQDHGMPYMNPAGN